MDTRLMVMTAAALIGLAGCARGQDVTSYAAVANAYSVEDHVQLTPEEKLAATCPSGAAVVNGVAVCDPGLAAARDAAYAAAAAEHRARAECVYQAQMANVTTPGLLSGFLSGLGAGQTCINYYRNLGVIR